MEKAKVNQSELDGVQYHRSSTSKIVLSQFTYLPIILLSVLLTYISYLQSAGYGIATAAAGIILTAVNLFDGITDPIIARIIDNFNTKYGKIRILLFVGYVISAISIFIMYCVTSNGKFGTVTFILIDLIFYIGVTIYGVTQQIIPPVLTNDPMQRPQINLWATLIGVFPPIIFSVLVSTVMLPRYNNEYSIPMLRTMCIIVLAISFVSLLIGMFGLSEADRPENFMGLNLEEEKVSFKDMIKMFKENSALRSYFFAAASDRLATTMSGQAIVTTLIAGVLMKNMGTYSMISMIPMTIGMVALFPIAKKNGKKGSKEAMKYWSVIALLQSAVQFGFYYIVMKSGHMDAMMSSAGLIVVFCVLATIRGIAQNGNGNATSMMMADVIDYQCYLTGKYMPAAVSATYSFLDKIIGAFGSTITLTLLTLVGYKTTMPQPTDEATMPIFFVTMFVSLGTPAIGWIINLLAMRMNPLTKEKMVEVQKRNYNRMQNDYMGEK